jgi:acyl-CoA dehydrogenase
MSWDFETDPKLAEELAWARAFVRDEVEPVDHLVWHAYNMSDPVRQRLIPPLQDRVRERGMWAWHLPPALGGQGRGQVQLALLNEILGGSHCAPVVFGCQAPDSGNAEILAHFGSEHLRETFLGPLLRNEIVSAFSMTEPQGGSDPTQFSTTAELDCDEWVLNGEKWFTSHAPYAAFFIVLAVTAPNDAPHRRMSMFVVPADTPGIEIIRNVGFYGHDDAHSTHAYIRYNRVRVPSENLLGGVGQGFLVAQTRLGGGRIHHAMRTVALVKNAFDALCQRALSRSTKGDLLANKQLIQEMIAESWVQIEQFRLLVLRTAWKIDKYNDYEKVRADISAVKVAMPGVLRDVASRALQVHGSLGASNEMPFGAMIAESYTKGLADGPTEIHKTTLARQVLKSYSPTDELFPSSHLPGLRSHALEKYGEQLSDLPPELIRQSWASTYR